MYPLIDRYTSTPFVVSATFILSSYMWCVIIIIIIYYATRKQYLIIENNRNGEYRYVCVCVCWRTAIIYYYNNASLKQTRVPAALGLLRHHRIINNYYHADYNFTSNDVRRA